jgi:lipid-A-disaccharide synthase
MSGGPHLFLVAGEPSGDVLGARLMEAVRAEARGPVRFSGVGGEEMERQGLKSLFSLSETALIGALAIARRLFPLIRRIRETAEAAIASDADALVIIDSPEFTHRVAKRVRRRRPDMLIIDYVAPTVWAWRPWRARSMLKYVDHVMALLPFEPQVMADLGGPPCNYVGHPLTERIAALRGEKSGNDVPDGPFVLVVLPGSRVSEVSRLMEPFGEVVRQVADRFPGIEVIVPAVSSLRPIIEEMAKNWPVRPEIVSGNEAKIQAFRRARVALAASGTVSLELALARVPMVIGYRVEQIMVPLKVLMLAHSFVLPNLIISRNAIPEFLHKECTAEKMAEAVVALMNEGEARATQLAALDEVAGRLTTGEMPSVNAARTVLSLIGARKS